MLDFLPKAVQWGVLVLMAGAVLTSVISLSRARGRAVVIGIYAADRQSDIVHVLMLTAMLVMGISSPRLMSKPLWCAIFGAIGAVSALLLGSRIVLRRRLRETRDWSPEIASGAYHVVAALAMLYATVEMAGAPVMNAMHSHAAAPVSAVTWALAALFAVDAAGQILIVVSLRAPGLIAEKLPRSTRLAAFPHVTMDVAMALMLLGSAAAPA